MRHCIKLIEAHYAILEAKSIDFNGSDIHMFFINIDNNELYKNDSHYLTRSYFD